MGKPVFYINGKFVEENEASISIMDHGFLYGDGIFEAFRAYKGRIFQFNEHMNRLYDSAKIIALNIPLSKEEFKKSTVVVYVVPLPGMKKDRSIRIIISSYQRPSACILPGSSKMTQYINLILARMEAKARGVDDALLLDTRGFVSEGPGWNIFLVKDRTVITPSIASSILVGITRNVMIRLFKELNYTVEERDVVVSELFTADEIFGTGTGTEITPVIEVNGRKIGEGKPGPVTNRIDEKFKEFKKDNGTPVYE
ncbi:MAG: aminotransferase class IV [Deltaproteobacteria bacterium]|nr:aminotransferase class IV [Deltaproteobacteria bacterium]